MNNIRQQYKTAQNLNTRISIHAKYSVNKQGFDNWIASHYALAPGMKILELGCGTGDMWVGKALPTGCHLTLTDFSAGMLKTAKDKLSGRENTDFAVVDIQDIPCPNSSFDAAIANMMLYHVPDLHRGLAEVSRVLKPGGLFYCATYGEHGIMEYVNGLLSHLGISGSIGKTFTLQNGGDSLCQHFKDVQRFNYEDSLAITDVEDFADYILSMSSLTNLDRLDRNVLLPILETRMEHGVLTVSKEYGMFICRKEA